MSFLAIAHTLAIPCFVDAVPSLDLTSGLNSSRETFCPGQMVFTCTATDISVLFRWELDDISICSYAYRSTHVYPLNLTVSSALIDSIQIISATVDGNSLDLVSTLRVSDLSVLNGSSLHCEDALQRESNAIDIVVSSIGNHICNYTL